MNLTCLKSGIWQAELRVPKDVRPVMGRTRFAKSMGTRDKREAVMKAVPILEQWQSDIDLARSDREAFVAKQILTKAHEDSVGKPSATGASQGHLEWLEDLPPSKALLYEAIEWGSDIPLPAYMNAFIKSHYTKPGTQAEARRYILEATIFMPTLPSLTRLNAQRWLTEEESKDLSVRRALKTMQKATGYLAEYISWLQYRNLVCQSLTNPFRGLHYPKALTRSKQYEPLSYDEICLLRTAAESRGDELMVTYIDIARFTGMRLSEIGALNTDSIELIDGIACFRVKSDAKTAASANRLIPISKKLQSLVDLEHLDMKNLGTAVGKRFGRVKKHVLVDGEDRSKCFHSIRKFVVTTLEQAGIPEGVAADLVGHEKPNITYNVYSGGSSIEQLSHAVEVLERRQQVI